METYNGHIRSPADAIILFEACRLGLLPRVQRRLSEKERQLIRSGSVFVWDEREAGMRRWTDGKSWSASRVSGSFLTYREMEGKRGGSGSSSTTTTISSSAGPTRTPESARNSTDDSAPPGDVEEGPDGYRYKPDGLMKQSFSITTSQGQHLHLISYYARSHPTAPGLRQPSNDPTLSQITPAKGMYPETTVNDQSSVPATTQTPMAGAPNYAMPPTSPYSRPGSGHPQGYMLPAYAQSYGYMHGQPPPPPPGYMPPAYHQHAGLPPPGYSSAPYAYAPQHLPLSQPPPPPPVYDQRSMHNPDASRPPPPPTPPALRQPSLPQANGHYPASQPPAYSRPSLPPVIQAESQPPAPQIDPRLTGSTPAPPSTELKSTPNGTSHAPAAPVATTTGQAPTISTLVNGNTSPVSKEQGDPQDSISPGGTRTPAGQMKDIPSEKLGFREDSRALRQLDKVFAV